MNTSSIIITHTLSDESSSGICEDTGKLTRGMVRNRAVALAVMNGRQPHEVLKSDWEDAKLEFTENPKS